VNDSPPRLAVRRFRRTLVFAAAAVWILFLAALTLWTANPVTLNRDQILFARSNGAVIVGLVVSSKSGQVKVEEVLALAEKMPIEIAPGRELTAESLEQTGVKDGERAVLPVIVRPSGEVSIAPTPTGTARAYPATSEVVNAVKQLIAAK
jgi:hypothetical protein